MCTKKERTRVRSFLLFGFALAFGLEFFEVVCAVLAQWADEVFRKLVAFVYVSAYCTYIALSVCVRLWLNVVLIECVSHRFSI